MAASLRLQRFLALRMAAAGLLVVAGGLGSVTARADEAIQASAPYSSTRDLAAPDAVAVGAETAWWRDGVAVFANLWDDTRTRLADEVPDWLHHLSRRRPAAAPPESRSAYVVLQDDRADGMELVTLRYRLTEQGALRTYAGAGLNHARYFVDDPAGATLLTRRDRQSELGATAELGAELALSGQVHLNADLRWADLDERAGLLHSAYGPVAADPVTLGISLGYRFR